MFYKLQKQYRHKEYDYSKDGFYFVTICCKDRRIFFGNIKSGEMQLSKIGKIAEKFWKEIPDHFSSVKLDKFVIMPNHIHGIIEIDNNNFYNNNDCLYVGEYPRMSKISPKPESLSVIIGSFKSITTKIVNSKFYEMGFAWQPRFYDRIIRNNDELNRIRQYIISNPQNSSSAK